MKVTLDSIKTEFVQLITAQQAWHYHVVPKMATSEEIVLFSSEENISKQNELGALTGKRVRFELVDSQDIHSLLSKYYRRDEGKNKSVLLQEEDANFIKTLIIEARGQGSSDIHIEPQEKNCRVRIRIDGKLMERFVIKKNSYPKLINKIKVDANLDISEKRLPQDGRLTLRTDNEKFDLRISILPSLYGEKVVIRILGSDADGVKKLNELGLNEQQLAQYQQGVGRSNGIILISGPTGSGKTTTLYATLSHLNSVEYNIVTIEDPIEYTLDGITQVQLKESIGLNFPVAMKTFLRQDPDIIMVGEIRDVETAEMAIRASLTGHLVLSTIHTNSALGTINRLRDMGIPSFLIADTLNMSVAQRLVRLICKKCRALDHDVSKELRGRYGVNASSNLYKSVGCVDCHFTGYKGRKAVFEIVVIDEENKEMIGNNDLLREKRKVKTLKESCIKLVESGETSLLEVSPILLG